MAGAGSDWWNRSLGGEGEFQGGREPETDGDPVRPRVLYELSRRLTILLEEGLRGGGVIPRIPVFLCHPHDPLEGREGLENSVAAILYPVRIAPEPRFRGSGMEWEPASQGQSGDLLRLQSLWVTVRYLFLVAGGTLELELEALGAALRTISDHPALSLELEGEPGEPAETVVCPLSIVEPSEGWRDLGLEDHRLLFAFEAAAPIRSLVTEPVGRVLEREVSVGGGEP